MSGELANQIIARILVIVLGFGIAWLLAKGVAFIVPSWETPIFAGFGSIWLIIGVRGLVREIQFQRSRSS
jgi:hypothetical protein